MSARSDTVAVVMTKASAALHSLVFTTMSKQPGLRHAKDRLIRISDTYRTLSVDHENLPYIAAIDTDRDTTLIAEMAQEIDWNDFTKEPLQWVIIVVNADNVVIHQATALAAYEFYQKLSKFVPQALTVSMSSWAETAKPLDVATYQSQGLTYRLTVVRRSNQHGKG